MKPNYFFRLLIVSIFFVGSCQKSPVESIIQMQDGKQPNAVAIEEAKAIANVQAPLNLVGSKNSRVATKKTIKSTLAVNPKGSDPLMFIVNYEGGGFIIISGDNRMTPILAYSESNPFPTDQKNLPGGLVDWLSSVDEAIEKLRTSNVKQSDDIKKVWERFKKKSMNDTFTNPSGRTMGSVTYDGDCNYGSTGYTQ